MLKYFLTLKFMWYFHSYCQRFMWSYMGSSSQSRSWRIMVLKLTWNLWIITVTIYCNKCITALKESPEFYLFSFLFFPAILSLPALVHGLLIVYQLPVIKLVTLHPKQRLLKRLHQKVTGNYTIQFIFQKTSYILISKQSSIWN